MYKFDNFRPAEIRPSVVTPVPQKEFGPVRRYGSRPLRIYLAGPIGKHCWRHCLVPGLRDALYSGDAPDFRDVLDTCNKHEALPCYQAVNRQLEFKIGSHFYVGPFFIACDHGCAHGSNSHGVAAGGKENSCITAGDGGFTQDQVREFCRSQIDSADLIFAWIDRELAYGTIWELGYATARNKDIVVRWPTGFDISDMWLSLPEDARPAEDLVSAFEETVSAPARALEPLPVDSPIEASLRDALFPLVSGRFVLKTRHTVGPYKLDFAVWNESNPSWRVAVECDGHEFHEKTKDQAARDRSRERDLVFEGWTVLRFTGREIHRDANRCAQDVMRQCLRLDGLQK